MWLRIFKISFVQPQVRVTFPLREPVLKNFKSSFVKINGKIVQQVLNLNSALWLQSDYSVYRFRMKTSPKEFASPAELLSHSNKQNRSVINTYRWRLCRAREKFTHCACIYIYTYICTEWRESSTTCFYKLYLKIASTIRKQTSFHSHSQIPPNFLQFIDF